MRTSPSCAPDHNRRWHRLAAAGERAHLPPILGGSRKDWICSSGPSATAKQRCGRRSVVIRALTEEEKLLSPGSASSLLLHTEQVAGRPDTLQSLVDRNSGTPASSSDVADDPSTPGSYRQHGETTSTPPRRRYRARTERYAGQFEPGLSMITSPGPGLVGGSTRNTTTFFPRFSCEHDSLGPPARRLVLGTGRRTAEPRGGLPRRADDAGWRRGRCTGSPRSESFTGVTHRQSRLRLAISARQRGRVRVAEPATSLGWSLPRRRQPAGARSVRTGRAARTRAGNHSSPPPQRCLPATVAKFERSPGRKLRSSLPRRLCHAPAEYALAARHYSSHSASIGRGRTRADLSSCRHGRGGLGRNGRPPPRGYRRDLGRAGVRLARGHRGLARRDSTGPRQTRRAASVRPLRRGSKDELGPGRENREVVRAIGRKLARVDSPPPSFCRRVSVRSECLRLPGDSLPQ